MTGEGIPASIRNFIRRNIHSVEALEILLALHSEPETCWTAEDLSRLLRTTIESATSNLSELKQAGLLAMDSKAGKSRFAPADAGVAGLIDELERIYKERRVSVISLIYSKPSERVRAFSDAFRLRKEEE